MLTPLTARLRQAVLAACAAGAVALLPATAQAAPAAPADSIRDSQQWVLSMLDVRAAWQTTQGAGVTVAVIDSGVYPDISDLSGSVVSGPDLTGLTTSERNPHWGEHGTWMASIIAGHGHDGGADGIVGVAPGAKILSIRVIPDKRDPYYKRYEAEPEQEIQQSLARGIREAVNDHARVISMSIGYSSPSAVVRSAVQYAFRSGVVLVASSGNSGQDDERRDHGFAPVSFPADYPGVISVGALNSLDAPADFSSNNLSVQVAAPGVKVPAQGRDGLYWTVDGTSPACALVAGVAALIKSRYPDLAPALVIQALTGTAANGSSGGYNPKTGFGTVDAAKALLAAGQLAHSHPARSQVAPSARFGGGARAIPDAPVAPRGTDKLVGFATLGIMSLMLMLVSLAWLAALHRRRRDVTAAYTGTVGLGYPPASYWSESDNSAARTDYE